MKIEENNEYAIISKEEKKLLEHLRDVSYGQITIHMQDGKPTRIELIKQSIAL